MYVPPLKPVRFWVVWYPVFSDHWYVNGGVPFNIVVVIVPSLLLLPQDVGTKIKSKLFEDVIVKLRYIEQLSSSLTCIWYIPAVKLLNVTDENTTSIYCIIGTLFLVKIKSKTPVYPVPTFTIPIPLLWPQVVPVTDVVTGNLSTVYTSNVCENWHPVVFSITIVYSP